MPSSSVPSQFAICDPNPETAEMYQRNDRRQTLPDEGLWVSRLTMKHKLITSLGAFDEILHGIHLRV